MSRDKTDPLFIQGVQKTGTSTLVGMLNTHPEIFILYETRMDRSLVSKYGNQLLEGFPEARRFFRNTSDIGQPYMEFTRFLERRIPEFHYRYLGDKIISLNSQETHRVKSYRTIYAIRDVRTWLCKEQIIRHYRNDIDLIPPAIDYLRYVIGIHRYSNCLRIRLEDIVERNDQVLSTLSQYLDLDISLHADHWWQKIGQYESKNPKNLIKWFSGHASSKVKPDRLDTVVEIKSHPFWNDFLPLFDKYYKAEVFREFNINEVNADLAQAEDLLEYSPLPLDLCYKDITSKRFTAKQDTAPQGYFFRALRKINSIAKKSKKHN